MAAALVTVSPGSGPETALSVGRQGSCSHLLRFNCWCLSRFCWGARILRSLSYDADASHFSLLQGQFFRQNSCSLFGHLLNSLRRGRNKRSFLCLSLKLKKSCLDCLFCRASLFRLLLSRSRSPSSAAILSSSNPHALLPAATRLLHVRAPTFD